MSAGQQFHWSAEYVHQCRQNIFGHEIIHDIFPGMVHSNEIHVKILQKIENTITHPKLEFFSGEKWQFYIGSMFSDFRIIKHWRSNRQSGDKERITYETFVSLKRRYQCFFPPCYSALRSPACTCATTASLTKWTTQASDFLSSTINMVKQDG